MTLFIDDDCIASPDKGSNIHYIVVFAIITYAYVYIIYIYIYACVRIYKDINIWILYSLIKRRSKQKRKSGILRRNEECGIRERNWNIVGKNMESATRTTAWNIIGDRGEASMISQESNDEKYCFPSVFGYTVKYTGGNERTPDFLFPSVFSCWFHSFRFPFLSPRFFFRQLLLWLLLLLLLRQLYHY